MMLLYITIGLLMSYAILILYYRAGWMQVTPFEEPTSMPTVKISVVVAARNEEENIGALLGSIQSQTYSPENFEVIVVDDHSTDNTATIVKLYPFAKLVQLQFDNINSYKKKAIETGVAAATGDLIVTTDADCEVPKDWLKTIAAFKEKSKALFIAAPVSMSCNSSLLQIFQALDFLVLQGITAASVQKKIHNMCNGANLAYERKIFQEVNGFAGIDHIASGDDMLLMQKIAERHPGRIVYLLSKDAIVITHAEKTWKNFFYQRIRWASKATTYNDIKIFSALFLVYFFNCSLLALTITAFWLPVLWLWLAGVLFAKILVESYFLNPVAKFYSQEKLMTLFPFFQPLHIIYTVIAGFLGVFGDFHWKGRRVK
jgi:poly-beta-1,6-N-acetyl-D-glucosamine synthase